MRSGRVIAGVVLAVVGVLWIGQGLGYVGGSAMTGDPLWAVIGSVLVVVAAALVSSGRRRGA